jgi:hypothetical protein
MARSLGQRVPRLSAVFARAGVFNKICAHQCKSAAEHGFSPALRDFPLRSSASSVVQGFGSHNCNPARKDAGLDNTKLLRGLNADC